MKKLTDKQDMFCRQYLTDFNATQAAIRAGYSRKTAKDIACQNLAKLNIQNRITELKSNRINKIEITAERVLQELGRIAFFDPRKLFNEDGTLKKITELDDDTAAAIAGVDVTTLTKMGNDEQALSEITKKIKHVDKKGSLELLGRHLAMWQDNLNINGIEFTVKNLTDSDAKTDINI